MILHIFGLPLTLFDGFSASLALMTLHLDTVELTSEQFLWSILG
jgi:hypothetical protein